MSAYSLVLVAGLLTTPDDSDRAVPKATEVKPRPAPVEDPQAVMKRLEKALKEAEEYLNQLEQGDPRFQPLHLRPMPGLGKPRFYQRVPRPRNVAQANELASWYPPVRAYRERALSARIG